MIAEAEQLLKGWIPQNEDAEILEVIVIKYYLMKHPKHLSEHYN